MTTLTLCMIVRNEARCLARCLQSVAGLVDQIVVIDTGSDDATPEIARAHAAEVHPWPWRHDFAAARNESLQHALGDWILVLDADEWLAPEAAEHVRELMAHGPYCYELKIRNYLSDGGDADAMEHHLIRLFPNQLHHRYLGRIHEQLVSLDPERPLVRRGVSRLMIMHDGYHPAQVEAQGKQARNRVLLEQALADDPENGFHYFNLAQNEQNAGETAAAEASLWRCLQLAAPDAGYLPPAWNQLTGLLAERGELTAAQGLLVNAPAACLDGPDYWLNRGSVLMMLARLPEAIAAFERAALFAAIPPAGFAKLDRASMTWKPMVSIANAYLAQGYPETAHLYLTQALAQCPNNPAARERLAEIEGRAPWLAAA